MDFHSELDSSEVNFLTTTTTTHNRPNNKKSAVQNDN